MYVCIYVCMCVYVCMYTYIHIFYVYLFGLQTDSQTIQGKDLIVFH